MNTSSPNIEDHGDVFTPEEIPAILHIGRSSTYQLLKKGELRSIKVAGKYRIPKQYLLEFLYPDRTEK